MSALHRQKNSARDAAHAVAPADRPRNRLLLALPPRVLSRIRPDLQYVVFKREQILLDADTPLDFVFFPDGGVRLLGQIPGTAAKLSNAAFARAMETMPAFRTLMFAYTHAFLEQVLVSVACNGAHTLDQRLARWLLTMRDRSDHDALPLTQNLLAEMLGVQRPTISNVARKLEGAGFIERGRRCVTIRDRRGLERHSCECYKLVRARTSFHLPKTYT